MHSVCRFALDTDPVLGLVFMENNAIGINCAEFGFFFVDARANGPI